MNGQNGLVQWFMLAVVPAVMGGGCLALSSGCSGKTKATPQEIEQRMEVAKQWGAMMKELGVSGQVTLHWRGIGKLALEQAASADIGVDLHAAMQFGGTGIQPGEDATVKQPTQEQGDGN